MFRRAGKRCNDIGGGGAAAGTQVTSRSIHVWPLRRVLLAMLLLLAASVVPRALMLGKYDVPCRDGTYYLITIRAILSGNEILSGGEHFNLFPVIGALLARAGVDPAIGLQYLNLACSSLVALVLFDWLRRWHPPLVAWTAGLLVAGHPKQIEWSCELVRDPSFLFFFVGTLWVLWLTRRSTHWAWFMAGGSFFGMAVQTRFEGWLLLIPAAAWWAHSLRRAPQKRSGIVLGAALFLIPLVLITLAMNVMIHVHPSRYEFGANLHRLHYFRMWAERWQAWLAAGRSAPGETSASPAAAGGDRAAPQGEAHTALQSRSTAAAGAPDSARDAADRPPRWLWVFLRTMERGFSPAFGLLTLAGLWWRGRRVVRSQWPIVLTCLLGLAGICVQLGNIYSLTSSRYLLMPVLLCSPLAAAGLLVLARRGVAWSNRWWQSPQAARWAVLGLALLGISAWGWGDALTSVDSGRLWKAEVGQWVLREVGAHRVIATTSRLRSAAYFAHAQSVLQLPLDRKGEAALAWLREQQPELLIAARRDVAAETWTALQQNLVLLQSFQQGKDQVAVFRCDDRPPRTARGGPVPRQ